MQALNRFILMLGGGYAGSALYNNKDNLPVFLGSSISDFAKHFKVSNGGGNNGVEKQLENLTQDMRALMMSNRNGTIVVSASQGSGLTKVILILVPGAGFYLWYKGVRISDLKWVSRKSFDQAVAALSTAQDALSQTVTDFRQSVQKRIADFQTHVESRFRNVESQIDSQVGEVRDGVRSVQGTLEGLDNRVRGLEGRVEDATNQLQYTNQGIHLLCSVVAESVGTNSRSHRALQNFTQNNPMIGFNNAGPSLGMLDGEAPVLVEYVQQQPAPTQAIPVGVGSAVGLMLSGSMIPRVGMAFNQPVKPQTPTDTETDRESDQGISNPPAPDVK